MSSLSKHNDGYKFLLTVIDCFSKFAWAIPLQNKNGQTLLAALKLLLERAHPRKPNRLQTDKGKEFLNKPVQDFLTENAIHHFSSESDQKAAMVERFNRTLKTRMWKYYTAQNTYRYLDALDDLVYGYNHAKHRTIGMAPADVKMEHEEALWRRMYPDYENQKRKEGTPRDGHAPPVQASPKISSTPLSPKHRGSRLSLLRSRPDEVRKSCNPRGQSFTVDFRTLPDCTCRSFGFGSA